MFPLKTWNAKAVYNQAKCFWLISNKVESLKMVKLKMAWQMLHRMAIGYMQEL